MRGVYLKRKLKYIEKVVVASQLLHRDHYVSRDEQLTGFAY